MKTAFSICLIAIGVFFIQQHHDKELDARIQFVVDSLVHQRMEYAYFEGQRELLQNGDKRIYRDSCGKWHWLKSPWNEDTPFINHKIQLHYNP